MAEKFAIVDDWDSPMLRGPFGRSPWRGIMQFAPHFRKSLTFTVGNGRRVMFWEDIWCGDRTLKQDFPDLFNLATDPRSRVVENYSLSGRESI